VIEKMHESDGRRAEKGTNELRLERQELIGETRTRETF
jgi:hypothetical protein